MSATVVNLREFRVSGGRFQIHNLPPDVMRVSRGTPWGNPVVIGVGVGRSESIRRFRLYAIDRLIREPSWLDPLEGKRLACYCAPLACHATVLVELLGLRAAARAVMRSPAIAGWLDSPAPVFGGLAPRDLVALARTDEVVAALQALGEGTFT